MLKSSPNRLLLSLRRLSDSTDVCDAALLERFVALKDELAFEALLRRHGDMVLRVCRRHLESGPDAEDAFQAVFLVLARDAGRIAHRESLAGWLFRVAYHVSRKLMGKNARRRTLPLAEGDRVADTTEEFDRAELRAMVEEEVHALPDRFRAPVVLCYLEGRSNSEAAALLGCPRGTVDSRLATARRKLYQRLSSRGVALSGAGAVAAVWQDDGAAGAAGLTARTLEAVNQFARTGSAAGAASSHVLSLVAGVSQTMTANKLSVVIALAVAFSLLGGAGYTAFYASAEPPKEVKKPAGKSRAEKPPETPAAPPEPEADARAPATDREILSLLQRQAEVKDLENMPLRDLLQFLTEKYNVPIRIDLAAFARMRVPQALAMYETQVKLPITRGMTVGDILREALAQLDASGGVEGGGNSAVQVTFRIRNGQIAIVPAYVPFIPSVGTTNPGDADPNIQMSPRDILEQEEGEPITVQIEDKPFFEVLQELRRITGANIVLDARHKEKAKQTITATLNDVRLLAALRVLSDMSELQPVAMNNIYYITSKENAERLQKEIDRKRYGESPSLQQQQQQWLLQQQMGLGGLGGGLGIGMPPAHGGAGVGPAPAPKPEEKKPEEKKK
ncbi:MAG: RNA polymerase sigma factor [Gemmataceae bacterium]